MALLDAPDPAGVRTGMALAAPRLTAVPLTPAAYAPYGHVLMAAPRGEAGRPANQGTARRFDWLVPLINLRGARARLNACLFRCAPRRAFPLDVHLLERHPASTQLFVPMNARRYLVVVARGDEAPDLGTLAAFVATGSQGVSYHPGTWHHPIIALDQETDFACLVHEDGGAADCEEVSYPAGARPLVALPGEEAP